MVNSSIVLAVLLACALLVVLLAVVAAASRHKKAAAGALDLIGAIARVETDLQPEGSVLVQGELWRARARTASAALRRGSKARVVGASGHLLEVEPTD